MYDFIPVALSFGATIDGLASLLSFDCDFLTQGNRVLFAQALVRKGISVGVTRSRRQPRLRRRRVRSQVWQELAVHRSCGGTFCLLESSSLSIPCGKRGHALQN
jgi:hypothetical protein